MMIGIAMIYALEVVLLTLLIWISACPPAPAASHDDGAGVFHLVTVIYRLAV